MTTNLFFFIFKNNNFAWCYAMEYKVVYRHRHNTNVIVEHTQISEFCKFFSSVIDVSPRWAFSRTGGCGVLHTKFHSQVCAQFTIERILCLAAHPIWQESLDVPPKPCTCYKYTHMKSPKAIALADWTWHTVALFSQFCWKPNLSKKMQSSVLFKKFHTQTN